MTGRVRAAVVVAVIAVSSAIVGAAIDRAVIQQARRRPPSAGSPSRGGSPQMEVRRRTDMLERMTKELALTPAQRVAVDSVMQRTDSSLRAIRVEMQPRIEQVFQSSRAEIRARLTPEQQANVEEVMRPRWRGRGR